MNGGQTAATIESIITDGSHAIGDVDRNKTITAVVFANRFISEIYFLNGRKVVTLILQKTKNGKI